MAHPCKLMVLIVFFVAAGHISVLRQGIFAEGCLTPPRALLFGSRVAVIPSFPAQNLRFFFIPMFPSFLGLHLASESLSGHLLSRSS